MWYSFTCGVHVGSSRKMAMEGMLVFRLPSLLKLKLFRFLLRIPVKNFLDLFVKEYRQAGVIGKVINLVH